jgi:hypothetical protein
MLSLCSERNPDQWGKKVDMVVGKDILIKYIPRFLGKTLVGRFYSKEVRENSLARWMDHNWVLVLGYKLVFHILVRGWFCFIFQTEEDYENILGKGYCYGS